MYCISTFLEPMNHEFDEHPQIIVPRDGYKVDGEGIKKQCKLNTEVDPAGWTHKLIS
jgi:hypothetical protein